MKFEEIYPEFGIDGARKVEEHLKSCPICVMMFNIYKKEKLREVLTKEDIKIAINNVAKKMSNHCTAEMFNVLDKLEKELKL